MPGNHPNFDDNALELEQLSEIWDILGATLGIALRTWVIRTQILRAILGIGEKPKFQPQSLQSVFIQSWGGPWVPKHIILKTVFLFSFNLHVMHRESNSGQECLF